jgi:hypothetical protein
VFFAESFAGVLQKRLPELCFAPDRLPAICTVKQFTYMSTPPTYAVHTPHVFSENIVHNKKNIVEKQLHKLAQ